MKFTSLLFALLFLVAQTGNAQTPKPSAGEQAPKPTSSVRMDAANTGKGLSDAEILQRADQIRYRALYQDYSNIVNALADSKLEVSDRLTAFNRLTEMYFANKPKTVKLPTTLLKADGRPFSAAEMGDFMARLTKKPVLTTASKSIDAEALACIMDYYRDYWHGSNLALIYPDYVIVAHSGPASCRVYHQWLYLPISALPANN